MADEVRRERADARARAKAWTVDTALPFWIASGYDADNGGFFEATDFLGHGDRAARKRVRVQARQIYVMSHAHWLGWSQDALALARRGVDFLVAHAWLPNGGWAHVLNPDASIADNKRDAYDHAFVLLALAWYHRASGEARAREWIERTVQFMDDTLWDGTGQCWFEDDRGSLPRRQNPHMHLLEAFMALYEATGDAGYLKRADAIVSLFEARFFRKATGTLCEFFGNDWAPAPGLEGRIVEPGHHFEWVWLLSEYERLSKKSYRAARDSLFAFAARFGREPDTGLIYDAVLDDGTLHLATKRCWPQTEALRALIARHRDGADVSAQIDEIALNLLQRYLGTKVPGLWQDQFGPTNEPLNRAVPASSLYHIFGAFVPLATE